MAIRSDYSDLLLPKPQTDSTILSYLKMMIIPFLPFVFAIFCFFGFIKFSISFGVVLLIGIIFIFALIFGRHNAYFAFANFSNKNDEFKSALKSFIVSNLLEIADEKKSNLGFDLFFNKFVKKFRNSHIAGMGVTLFILLGILFAFVNIVLSLQGFTNLQEILKSVTNAFYIAIYGVMLAFWWLFFEKLGISSFDSFANEQRDISREFFWQKDELEQKFMSVSTKHFDDIRNVFARISNEEFFANLDNVVGNKFKSFADLQNLEQRMIGEAQVKIDQNIRLLNKAGTKQDEFVKVHTEILKTTIDLNSSLKDMQKSFSTEYNRLNELMQDRVNGFEKSVSKFDANLKELDLSLKNLASRIANEQKIAMEAFRVSLLEGIDAFRAVYEQEGVKTKSDIEREILLNDLKKNASELDSEVERVMKNIDSTENLQ